MKRISYFSSIAVIIFGSAGLFISRLSHRHKLRKNAIELGRLFTLLSFIASLASSVSLICENCCGKECCKDGCCGDIEQ